MELKYATFAMETWWTNGNAGGVHGLPTGRIIAKERISVVPDRISIRFGAFGPSGIGLTEIDRRTDSEHAECEGVSIDSALVFL